MTGSVPNFITSRALNSSLDYEIGKLNHSVSGVPLVSIRPHSEWPVTYDEVGAIVRGVLPSDAHRKLFPSPGCTPGPIPKGVVDFETFFGQIIPIVTEAFRCDRTRTFTINAPVQYGGDLNFDIQNCVYPDSQGARDCFRKYQVLMSKRLAGVVAALEAVPENGGSLLDNTVIVWLSSIAGRQLKPYPWYSVIVAGRNTGVRTGRYLHYGQNVSTSLEQGPISIGPAHNRFLVSLARVFGLDVNHYGAKFATLRDGLVVDTTGPLPSF